MRNQRIIDLHGQGFEPASIASQLGIRQHVAEDVLREAGLLGAAMSAIAPPPPLKNRRPALDASVLIAGGFHYAGAWVADAATGLEMTGAAPSRPGLYAFVAHRRAVYVGVTQRHLRARLDLYRPGRSQQPTNVRLRERLIEAVTEAGSVEIYTVSPPDSVWSGLPLNTAAGLEAAMLRRFDLPWNRRRQGR